MRSATGDPWGGTPTDKSPTDKSRTLLLALRRGILDQIAGDRTVLVEPFLRGGADLFGGDGANAVRPAPDVLDPQPGGELPPLPARQRPLIVLGVDRLRNQLGLDAFEVLWRRELLSDIGYHAIDHLLDLRKLHARLRRRRDHELGRIERSALVTGAGADRERPVHHQPAIQIAIAAPPHQLPPPLHPPPFSRRLG